MDFHRDFTLIFECTKVVLKSDWARSRTGEFPGAAKDLMDWARSRTGEFPGAAKDLMDWARSRTGDRPFKMAPAKVRLAMTSMGQPETSVAALCQELDITRQTLYRHIFPTGELREDGQALFARSGPSVKLERREVTKGIEPVSAQVTGIK